MMKKGTIDKKLNIEDNFFPNIQGIGKLIKKMMQENARKIVCEGCGKSGKPVRFYIIGDDIENLHPFCPKCRERFQIELLEGRVYCDGCKKKVIPIIKFGGQICPKCRKVL